MTRTIRRLLTFTIVLASAIFASVILRKLSPDSSWLALVGWAIFFAALQLPWIVASPSSQNSCSAWLGRFRKGA